MDRLSNILSTIPQFYNYDDTRSIIYNIIKAISEELDDLQILINQIDDLIGINNTNSSDLYNRWGSLLNIPKRYNESDDAYRNRLKLSCTSISGGTKQSIIYAIAISLDLQNLPDTDINNAIKVYDGWEYSDDYEYGTIVCIIDLKYREFSEDLRSIIQDAINDSKASGIVSYIIFLNLILTYYYELPQLTYNELSNTIYGDIGN